MKDKTYNNNNISRALLYRWIPVAAFVFTGTSATLILFIYADKAWQHSMILLCGLSITAVTAFYMAFILKNKALLIQIQHQQKAILDTIPDMVWLKDADYRYITANKPFTDACGLKACELAGKTDFDIWPADLAKKYQKDDEDVMTARTSKQMEEQVEDKKDRQRTWIDTIKTPIYDDNGNVVGTSGIARDITERRKLENVRMQQTQQHIHYQNVLLKIAQMESSDLAAAFKSIIEEDAAALGVERVSIWLYNDDDSAIICEDLYMLGQNEHQKGFTLAVKDYPAYFRSISESRIIAADDACTDSHTGEFTETYLKPAGITSMMDVFIRVHGKIVGVVCHEHIGPARQWTPQEQEFAASISDLISLKIEVFKRKQAEQKQAELLEQVEKANQDLKEFAYVTSHDLKAPLRGISSLAKWISEDYGDKFDEEGKKQIDMLLSRVNRMHNLIDGILQYSRVGRIKEKIVKINLNKLVPDVIDTLSPPANISVRIGNELPVVEFEETRIIQVFQNLISNAIKYINKPQGLVEIGCVEESGFWKFSVKDNGCGIEQKHFEKIFQIFQTLAPRDEFESTGVGLTVAKKIVELYGGRIWLESEIGIGTTFFFTLPVQKSEDLNDEKLKTYIAC